MPSTLGAASPLYLTCNQGLLTKGLPLCVPSGCNYHITFARRDTTVASNSMALLDELRKAGMSGDIDFLREACRRWQNS